MRPIKLTALILTLLMTFGLSSCGSQNKKSKGAADSGVTTEDQNIGSQGMDFELNGDSDSGKAGALATVYFDFNRSSLTSSTRDVLNSNANFLKDHPSVEIQVEGHADERGGVQYNLALGEKRAQAVKQYLISMGVSSSKITTISFGKERPIAFGHDDSAWSKNRRANFVVTAK